LRACAYSDGEVWLEEAVSLLSREHGAGSVMEAHEVAEAFAVPLAFLMNPAFHERRAIDFAGTRRRFYAMPYTAARRYFIWGATAAMLRNFYRFLSA
ncbi:MAG: coenzyme A pyrophosphatase, partial [Betaproteobacteria bacterium]